MLLLLFFGVLAGGIAGNGATFASALPCPGTSSYGKSANAMEEKCLASKTCKGYYDQCKNRQEGDCDAFQQWCLFVNGGSVCNSVWNVGDGTEENLSVCVGKDVNEATFEKDYLQCPPEKGAKAALPPAATPWDQHSPNQNWGCYVDPPRPSGVSAKCWTALGELRDACLASDACNDDVWLCQEECDSYQDWCEKQKGKLCEASYDVGDGEDIAFLTCFPASCSGDDIESYAKMDWQKANACVAKLDDPNADSSCVTDVDTRCTLLSPWDYVLIVFGAVVACMCCCMCYARSGRGGTRYGYRRRGFLFRRGRAARGGYRGDDEALVVERPNENVTIYGSAAFPGNPTYARLAERAAPGGPDSLEALVAEAQRQQPSAPPGGGAAAAVATAPKYSHWDPTLDVDDVPVARAVSSETGGGGGGGGGGTAAERIAALEAVRTQGSITQEEFEAQKARIIAEI